MYILLIILIPSLALILITGIIWIIKKMRRFETKEFEFIWMGGNWYCRRKK